MSKVTLQRLQELHDEYANRCDKLQRDLSQAYPSDSVEQAQARENDEVMEALLAEASTLLTQVDAAIERHQEGRYGLCTQCGDVIDDARLQALPTAQACIDCADQLSS
ncbi:TraR/DksA family transcriptional regulator [Halopseudomonas salegens]|uniref:Transcriptional regulator, TraR/DksA family n=1 Tax=Halopseudomonas salegens TaxID=1434072 RepID=A0A1H2DYM4_9GAMM|nr:TraR/DksA family transcriptional regulator [Halopseudomonas salegens]SDT87879.1 transcriptional regulator, TraR/DksA family [Halopseudomonas salegens]